MENKFERVREHTKQLLEIADKRNSTEYEWGKNILLMASGSISIIVSLHTTKSTNCYTHFFYSASIGLIALGILSGAIYLYAETSTHHRLFLKYRDAISKALSDSQKVEDLNVVAPYKIYGVMRFVFYFSLLLAVPCLAIYAILIDS